MASSCDAVRAADGLDFSALARRIGVWVARTSTGPVCTVETGTRQASCARGAGAAGRKGCGPAGTLPDVRGDRAGVSIRNSAARAWIEHPADHGLSSAEGGGESAGFSQSGRGGEAVDGNRFGCKGREESGDGCSGGVALGGTYLRSG